MAKMIGVESKLPVMVLKEGGMFVVYSPALDLSTCGPTYEEALKNFGEAIEIFFGECLRRETLDDALASCGWRKVHSRWQPPVIVGQETVPVEVPSPA